MRQGFIATGERSADCTICPRGSHRRWFASSLTSQSSHKNADLKDVGVSYNLVAQPVGGWFHATARPAHPAYRYWTLCQRMLAQGGVIHVSQQWAELPLLARMGLDALIFIDVTEGNAPLLQVGTLQGLGSPAVIRHIQERITDSQDFEDAMAELYVAAWYKGKTSQEKQYRATLQEEHPSPWPDLLVEHEALTHPLFYECKRLKAPSKNSISRSIRDANTQIRSAKERLSTSCYGVALLDLSPAYTLEILVGRHGLNHQTRLWPWGEQHYRGKTPTLITSFRCGRCLPPGAIPLIACVVGSGGISVNGNARERLSGEAVRVTCTLAIRLRST